LKRCRFQLLIILSQIGAMAFIVTLPRFLYAQDTKDDRGSVLFKGRDHLQGFSLEDIKGELELLIRLNSNKVDQQGGQNRKSNETSLETTLRLNTKGFFFHPNIIDFNLTGGFGIRRQSSDVDGNSTNSSGTLRDFGASASILRKEKFPMFVHASRSDGIVTRQFGPSLNTSSTIYGAQIQWKSPWMPTSFTYEHRVEDQKEQGGATDLSITEDTLAIEGNYRPSSIQQLNWAYNLKDTSQTGANRGVSKFTTQNLQISHSLSFGNENLNHLRSSMNYFDRAGDSPLSRMRVDESLHLRHNQQLQTDYQYSFDHNDFQDLSRDQQQFSASFTHQFYASILTTGSIGGSLIQQSDGFTSDEYYGRIGVDYRKNVPYGVLSAGVSYGRDDQTNNAGPQGTRIRNEPHSFNDPAPVVLNHQNIIISSIIVRDDAGIIVFTEGLDYTVQDFGTRVEIRRVLGGRINNGDTVLLDYDLNSEGSDKTTTDSFGFNIRYTFNEGLFKNFAVYARYFEQLQNVNGLASSTRIADDIHDLIYGANYEIGDLRITAEQQTHQSLISPFDATRFEASYTRRLNNISRLGLSASYRLHKATEPGGEDRKLFDLSGQYRTRLMNRLNLDLEAIFRDEDSSLAGKTQGFDQSLNLTWDLRQTHVFLQARNSILNFDNGGNTSQSLSIRITRQF